MTVSRAPLPTDSLRLMGYFARHHPGPFARVLGLSLAASLAEGVGVLPLLPILERALGGGSSALGGGLGGFLAGYSPGQLLAVMVLGIAAKAVLVFLAARAAGMATSRVAAGLRLSLIEALLAARLSHFTAHSSGAFVHALSGECERAAAAFAAFARLAASLFQTLLYLVLSLFIAWQGTLLALLFAAVLYWALHGLVGQVRQGASVQAARLKALSRRLADGLLALKALKAMGREERLLAFFASETRQVEHGRRQEVRGQALLQGLQEPLVVLFMVAGFLVTQAWFAIPPAHLFFWAILFYRTATRFWGVQSSWQGVARCEPFWHALQETIAAASSARESLPPGEPPAFTREIRVEGLSFSHDQAPLLSDLSFTIPKGSLVTITGPSGSGKSTLAALLAGLHRPWAGDVFLDDTPLARVDIPAWRRRLGFVPQEAVLLNESLWVNLTLGDPALSRAHAAAALSQAGCDAFLAALPEGMETVAGERGERFSGGQRQRIALARALIMVPSLLILDEATAALDPQSEADICATLAALKGRTTMVAISHQPALAALADRVYRLEGGRILRIR